ncbi:MAG TPA: hypothetical protein V6D12_18940 [Candidatus Obscuribacterales bacterium]
MFEFLGISFIVISLVLTFIFFQQRNTKIKLLKTTPVVGVNGLQIRYQNLALQNYAVPIKVVDKNKVQVIFPKLTKAGNVEYIYSWHYLINIYVPELTLKRKNRKINTIKAIGMLIKEKLQIEQEISVLEKQHDKINELAGLVSFSEVYTNYVETYKRALVQIENVLEQARELRGVYACLIKEVLIGLQVAEYNPDTLQLSQVGFDLQYRRIKEEYQNMKEAVNVYTHLLQESRNINL